MIVPATDLSAGGLAYLSMAPQRMFPPFGQVSSLPRLRTNSFILVSTAVAIDKGEKLT
jgi:hypothetical protein